MRDSTPRYTTNSPSLLASTPLVSWASVLSSRRDASELLQASPAMPSKYDAYWKSRATDLVRLVEAAAAGHPTEVDVSDIRNLGDRASWYGNVAVRGSDVLSGSMAHAT